jgi:hypothetical protein
MSASNAVLVLRRAAGQHATNEPVAHSEMMSEHEPEMGPERQRQVPETK